ncbi:MAG: SPOR domain-containing protein [Leptospiraceae bacterium]|nr:SPOR domain-containing protein [Leptospiraceae bacterium]
MLLFGLGMYLGSRYERFVITRQMETQTLEKESAQKSSDEFRSANLPPQEIPNPTLSEDTGSPTKQNAQNIEKALRESRELYLILARIYSDEKEAYRHGHQLKQMGFPVFLAKSGQKTKIYVGPLEGKKEAYEQLAKIKAMSNFRGAILYKK